MHRSVTTQGLTVCLKFSGSKVQNQKQLVLCNLRESRYCSKVFKNFWTKTSLVCSSWSYGTHITLYMHSLSEDETRDAGYKQVCVCVCERACTHACVHSHWRWKLYVLFVYFISWCRNTEALLQNEVDGVTCNSEVHSEVTLQCFCTKTWSKNTQH
jgi:hypothetical protein